MRHSRHSKQRATASKKSRTASRSSAVTKKGMIASVLVVGVLAIAALVPGMTRKWKAWTAAAGARPEVETAPASAAQVMMGADPRKEFVPGPAALGSTVRPANAAKPAPLPVAGFEGLIALDPMCEAMDPPTPKLAPGHPAPIRARNSSPGRPRWVRRFVRRMRR